LYGAGGGVRGTRGQPPSHSPLSTRVQEPQLHRKLSLVALPPNASLSLSLSLSVYRSLFSLLHHHYLSGFPSQERQSSAAHVGLIHNTSHALLHLLSLYHNLLCSLSVC